MSGMPSTLTALSGRTVLRPATLAAEAVTNAPWPAARSAAYHLADQLDTPRSPVADTSGLVLGEPVVARSSIPPHDAAAMDGWAVAGVPPWRVVGEMLAGDPTREPGWDRLEDGTAVVIATGAPVPPGAVAVLRHEDGAIRAGRLHPTPTAARFAHRHIRPAGEEARPGDVLLPAGTRLSPPAAGLAAAAGYDDVLVHRAARVRAFVLGDELLDTGVPRDGRVRDALGPQLPAWLGALGATGLPPRRIPDRLDVLVDALAGACRRGPDSLGADVVVTTGGSSAGPQDHVRTAVRDLGGRILVDGVAVRPGHPMALAVLPGDVWLVALPGNPFAACAALLTLAQPLLDRLHGLPEPVTSQARTAVGLPPAGDVHRLLPGRRTGGSVTPLPYHGSGMLRGLALADTLLVAPPEGAAAGSAVAVLPLPWRPTSLDQLVDLQDDEGITS